MRFRRPAATLAVLVAAAAAGSPPAAAGPDAAGCTPGGDWGARKPQFASRVVALVNAHRSRLHMRPLRVSRTLTRSAEWKALHMARFRYMQHEDPAPPAARSVGDRLAACGYSRGTWGENIAFGYPTPETVVSAWLQSPGHRANIEQPSYSAIGVGVATGNGTLYWAQNFGVYSSGDAPGSAKPSRARPRKAPQRPANATPLADSPLTISRLLQRTRRPTAGFRFSSRVVIGVRETGARITAGQVKCDAYVGNRHLRVVVNAFKNGRAVCAWRVPGWAKRRYLIGRVRVRAEGAQTVRWFSRRVR